ncbi:hypothetical protein PLESTB_001455600 [Pleodorina starrii]|uniref:Cilia-and flagella-associated protein 57 n=1 Tax=Pleodorina starrii TaxID=330485 RepID=A0A9W6BWK7_9CHLO|nr:hypothetical protein PLESTB_001455600 [Pleodorina starrii]
MATSTLAPKYIFGFRADVKDNIHYAEDGSVVYPAGHNVVLYSPDTRTQRLIPGTLESEGITALCVSSNKKLLAVAERSDKAMISVYDMQTLKRRKVLVSSDAGSKEYVSLSFSGDGKMLIGQGGAPEYNVVLWVWDKSKVASVVKTTNQQGAPLYSCAFSHGESSLVAVIGQGLFKMFRNADSGLKQANPIIGKRDPSLASCQCWVPDPPGSNEQRERLLLGMADGEVLLLEGTDLKAAFSCDNGLPACSIATYSKGFVVGQDGGVVTIFERDDKEFYRRARAFTIEGNPCKVLNLAISPNEEHLVASLENNQAYSLMLSNQEIMKQDEMNFEILGTPNHAGPVTGLDVCVRKALIASCCSTDRSVRLWNWVDRTCELHRTFADEIFSIAIHPTGLMVLVGFADKLRLMSVLMEDLKTVKELGIKGCRECCFSTGGQYFAAVNGTTISIYNTYTCDNVGNLRGHNGKVRSVAWSPDDSKLISAGMDGAVYEWRLRDLKREKEHVLKGCAYASVLATPDCKLLYATGTDKKIKEFEDSTGSGTTISKEIDTGGVNLTQLVLLGNARVMFAATESGGVRTYKYPLTGEFQESKCHAAPVSRLRVTWDESLLVSGGEDGSVFVWEVRDKDARAAARREQERLEYSVEVLVTRSELDEKRSRMAELEQQVAELTMQTEYQLRLKDLHLQERVKELTDKFTAEAEADRQKFEALLSEKNEMEMEYEEKLKAAEERAQAQLQALDTQYQAKIMAEVERYQALMQEKEMLAERWDEQNSLLVESHERVIAELTEDYEAKLAEEALKIEALQAEKAELEREFEEIKKQLEEDADREIEETKEKYEQKLQTERETSLRLKGENGIMRKKFNALQKDIEVCNTQIKELYEQKKELYATIASLEKDIASLKREIRERDETIGDKERRIYDLKKKNQELEKFKFVLDYKIKELKKQIEPREAEIGYMKEQIKEMDGELERYHKTNATLDLTIANMRLKQTGLANEVADQRHDKQDAHALLRRFQHDLQEVVGFLQEPKVLKEKVKWLYQKHCGELKLGPEEDGDVEREAARQREYLEKTVDSLKRKLAKDSELHRTDNLRIMQENTALIKEINELRREIKALKGGLASGAGLGGAGGGKVASARGGGGGRTSPDGGGGGQAESLRRELDMQRDLIARLREEMMVKEARIKQLEAMVVPRPISRERLPPMDGFPAATPPSAGAQQQQQQQQPPGSAGPGGGGGRGGGMSPGVRESGSGNGGGGSSASILTAAAIAASMGPGPMEGEA